MHCHESKLTKRCHEIPKAVFEAKQLVGSRFESPFSRNQHHDLECVEKFLPPQISDLGTKNLNTLD